MKRFAILALLALPLVAQSPNPTTSSLGIGASYNGSIGPYGEYEHAIPTPAGFESYATAYAITYAEVTHLHINPLSLETVITAGVGLISRQLGPVSIGDFVLEGGGMTGKNMGNVAGDQFFVRYNLTKNKKWSLEASGRLLHSAVDNKLNLGARIGVVYDLGRLMP